MGGRDLWHPEILGGDGVRVWHWSEARREWEAEEMSSHTEVSLHVMLQPPLPNRTHALRWSPCVRDDSSWFLLSKCVRNAQNINLQSSQQTISQALVSEPGRSQLAFVWSDSCPFSVLRPFPVLHTETEFPCFS